MTWALLSLLLSGAHAAGRASYPMAAGAAAGSIDTTKLATDAVTGVKILNAVVTTNKIASDAISTAKLLTDSVSESKILNAAVSTAKLASDAVSTSKILTDSVSESKVLNASISTNKLATDSVTAAKVLDSAISTTKLASDSVQTAKIMTDAVIGTAILNGAVSTQKLASGAVTDAKLNQSVRTCGAGNAITALSAINGITCEAFGSSSLGGSGSANTIAKWTAGTTLGNSSITDDGTIVTVTNETGKFSHNAGCQIMAAGWSPFFGASNSAGCMVWGTDVTGGLQVQFDPGGSDVYIDNRSNITSADIFFRTAVSGTPLTPLTVSGDGFVGINNTAPSVQLDVVGSAKISTVGLGTARALCMNSSNIISTCTSVVGADGTCTCQN